MSKLKKLRSAKTKPELARLLNIKASTFTYYLYIMGTQSQYNKFEIPKKNGGVRV